MMDLYAPGEIYRNVATMLTYRGGNLVGEHNLQNDALANKLGGQHYVTLTAERPPTDQRGAATIVAIIFSQNSTIANSLPSLRTLMNKTIFPMKKPNIPLEVLLITEYPIRDNLALETPAGVTWRNHPHQIFYIDITKSVNSPQHLLVREEVIAAWELANFTSRQNLPKILTKDPQVIYLGLRPGMVVEILSPSESAGYSSSYRIVV